MTSKNSVDTIIYEILKEIPDRDTICALDFGLISLAVQQAIEDGGIPKPDLDVLLVINGEEDVNGCILLIDWISFSDSFSRS